MKKTTVFLCFIGLVMTVFAQPYSVFSAVTSSGHTLYYNCVTSGSSIIGVQVSYPCYDNNMIQNGDYWYGYVKPTGNLVIDSVVTYGGVSYPVTHISASAFHNCSGLTSVTIPNSVTSIGGQAFYGCSGLTSPIYNNTQFAYMPTSYLGSYTIPNGITTIVPWAFYGCVGLTSIVIPNSVMYIGQYAFYVCTGLTSVVLGSGLINIGSNAFAGCSNIISIQSRCYPPSISSNTFSSVPVNIPVTVPCGVMSNYQNALYWSNFTHYVEGCVTITAVSSDATRGIVIGAGSYSIGDTVTLEAIPFDNAHFIRWSNNSTVNPLTFVAQQNATFFAIFGSGNANNDTVYVHDTIIVNNYVHDTTIITQHDTTYINNYIHDTTHVHDTTVVNNYIHDTVMVNNYIHDTTFVHDTTIVDNYVHDTIYVDNYIYDTVTVTIPLEYYTLSLASEQPAIGIVVGTGRYSDSTVVEVVAIPVQGNHFVQWSDGSAENPRHVTVIEDIELTASFAADEVGISDVQTSGATVSVQGSVITVRGASGQRVRIFDVVGRLLSTEQTVAETQHFRMMAAGVYLVQVGDCTAQRVVVGH